MRLVSKCSLVSCTPHPAPRRPAPSTASRRTGSPPRWSRLSSTRRYLLRRARARRRGRRGWARSSSRRISSRPPPYKHAHTVYSAPHMYRVHCAHALHVRLAVLHTTLLMHCTDSSTRLPVHCTPTTYMQQAFCTGSAKHAKHSACLHVRYSARTAACTAGILHKYHELHLAPRQRHRARPRGRHAPREIGRD